MDLSILFQSIDYKTQSALDNLKDNWWKEKDLDILKNRLNKKTKSIIWITLLMAMLNLFEITIIKKQDIKEENLESSIIHLLKTESMNKETKKVLEKILFYLEE